LASTGAAAPVAVRSVRATLRRELLAALPAAMDHENAEQIRLSRTRDARAGIRAAVSGASRFSRGSKQ
jgi:2-(1,2-epoxy-1,2-dihydrophenyl)acetyl-CoA isomerase